VASLNTRDPLAEIELFSRQILAMFVDSGLELLSAATFKDLEYLKYPKYFEYAELVYLRVIEAVCRRSSY
jgi:hypothetical protein